MLDLQKETKKSMCKHNDLSRDRMTRASWERRDRAKQLAEDVVPEGVSILNYRPKTLEEALLLHGHDIDFEPLREPTPIDARPGSPDRIAKLRARVERGESLFTEGDASCLLTKTDIILSQDL